MKRLFKTLIGISLAAVMTLGMASVSFAAENAGITVNGRGIIMVDPDMVKIYADIETTPDYLSNTTGEVSTDNFYWSSRMIAAMADASYKKSVFHIERYQEHVLSKGHEIINRYDDMIQNEADTDKHLALKHEANQAVADMLKAATSDTLGKVLYELSNEMKNAYSRSDA